MAITSPLMHMFGRSPIRPLQQHMDKSCICAEQLLPFFEAVLAQKWDEAEHIQQKIAQLEDEADELKRDLRLHLPNNLFLPVHRTDLLELLQAQDRVANMAQDIAGLVIGRKMILPTALQAEFQSYLERSVEASKQACKAINELDEVLAMGFRGNELSLISEMIVKLDAIERETDQKQIVLRGMLFHMEQSLPPVDVIFFYKLIERVGDLADRAQTVGGRLQLVIAR